MLEESLKNLSERVVLLKDNIHTEEATKTSIVMPFFQALGYDVFNPLEFVPEFTADVGIKKGEKVDYAIFINNTPSILIEAKSISEKLEKHNSQLFRYFGTTSAKFAILTNGIEYKFYSDLDEPNKMDDTPFFEFDILNITDVQISELKKFKKDNFDLDKILNSASDLKYLGLIKKALREQFLSPSDEFIKLILSSGVYSGIKTQAIIEKYRPIVKRALSQYINDTVNEKIQSALNNEPISEQTEENIETSISNEIITTVEELQAFYIVRSIVATNIDLDRITYKDTKSYFSILLDGKVTKWLCRLYWKETVQYIVIGDEESTEKIDLSSLNDIYSISDKLIKRLKQLIN